MDNNILDIITSYLKGRPSKTQVEEVMANEALQEEILFARQMQFTQAHTEEIRVQNILNDILIQSPDVQPNDELTEQLVTEDVIQLPKTGGNSAWIWGSSVIIALIGLLTVFYFNAPNDLGVAEEMDRLTHYIEPNLEKKGVVDLAVIAYNDENYETAIEYTKAYLETKPSDNNMKMYLALSYLYNGEYESSLTIFREIEKSTPFISKHLDYYMGIALLRTNETEAALSYFKQIPKENEHYESAKQILQKIENE